MTREQDFPIEELGRAIREARERAGLSRAGLAKRAGVTSKTVERWEEGSTLKARDRLEVVAGPLGCSEYDLVRRAYEMAGLEPPPIPQASGEERLVQMIRELQGGQSDLLGRIGHLEDLLEAEKKSGRRQDSPDPKQNNG